MGGVVGGWTLRAGGWGMAKMALHFNSEYTASDWATYKKFVQVRGRCCESAPRHKQ